MPHAIGPTEGPLLPKGRGSGEKGSSDITGLCPRTPDIGRAIDPPERIAYEARMARPADLARDFAPGLAVTAMVTLAAGALSLRYGAPLTLMALLTGLAANFLSGDPRLAPGLDFASRALLQLGIVLLGARVSVGQIADLGLPALAAVAMIAAATIGVGVLASRALGTSAAFGALAGGAVAICGASAALAFAAVLGERRIDRAQLSLVLVGISAMSAAAMFAYPLLAHQIGLSDAAAGFVFGASIHDVAQSLGAGFSYSAGAGETATVVKLSRVALLAPALAVVALFLGREPGSARRRIEIPWFVIAFFALAALTSLVAIPPAITEAASSAASWLLAAAVAATGIKAPLGELLRSGPRPIFVIAIATLAALLLALIAATLLFD